MRPSTLWVLGLAAAAHHARAYTVDMSSSDLTDQACSGMYAGKRGSNDTAHIELSFEQGEGQVALVVYEWADVYHLGVPNPALRPSTEDGDGAIVGPDGEIYPAYEEEVALPRTYVCTTDALRQSLCTPAELGQFIVRPLANATAAAGRGAPGDGRSVFTQGLRFVNGTAAAGVGASGKEGRGWKRQAGSSTSISTTTTSSSSTTTSTSSTSISASSSNAGSSSSIASTTSSSTSAVRPAPTSTPVPADEQKHQAADAESNVPVYRVGSGEIVRYEVRRTGYYCVGIVPVTLLPPTSSSSQAAQHASYRATLTFQNTFRGQLPAAEHPKITWYLVLACAWAAGGAAWGWAVWKYWSDILPVQLYITVLLAYTTFETFITFVYYRYADAHGLSARGTDAFLALVSVLNAGRNAGSWFALLVVSMGLSTLTPSLGSAMTRAQVLAGAHFVFGVVYSLGAAKVQLENASLIGLLAVVMGLSGTLTAFVCWTAVSLNGTLLHLARRKQHAKLAMFTALRRLLLGAVFALFAFAVLTSVLLSDRGSDDFAPRNWAYRWFLLDGSLNVIFAAVFAGVAWVWRPTGRNRLFAMSDELAQDEDAADAADYELSDSAARREGRPSLADDDDDALERGPPPGYDVPSAREREEVMFAIDDDEEDEDEEGKLQGRGAGRVSGERRSDDGSEGERLVRRS